MKRQLATTHIALTLAILCICAQASFAQCNGTSFPDGGNGTESNPFQISTPEQLQNLNYCLGSDYQNTYYVLKNDIDLTLYLCADCNSGSPGAGYNNGAGWQPIGNNASNKAFRGKINGNNYKVLGLWINRPTASYVGLFGYTNSSKISNIGVEIDNSNDGINANEYVGGLVGYNYWNSTITNSYATGSVTGNTYVGGLAGHTKSTITNSYATGSVTGTDRVGGLVGYQEDGTIFSCYAAGSVTGNTYVRGLVGYTRSYILNSYYDEETSSCKTNSGNEEGKTTAEMKTQSTFVSWDFDYIWTIDPENNNGYPSLLWQNPEHIVNATVAAIPSQTWTGSPIEPEPTITFKGTPLTKGTDFEYSYIDNIQAGTATLIIVGKSSYSGMAKTVGFTIDYAACGTGFAGGTGTETDPYKIAEAKNLDALHNCLGNAHSEKYYELQNDIDLSSYIDGLSGWTPIGGSQYVGSEFFGKVDGKNHKVLGLWINRPSNYVYYSFLALFGDLSGELKNIGVEIDNSKGGITGGEVSGLVNQNNGIITNCYVTGNVTSDEYNTGIVSGTAAGLVLSNNGNGTITDSYFTGTVTDGTIVGGLVGINDGTINNSYATGSVQGLVKGSDAGGLVGRNVGTITNSYYDKETSGQTDSYKGEDKTSAEMKTQSTFVDWDFDDIWFINGYPILQWQAQNKAVASYIPNQTYTGSAIEPAFTVIYNKTTLTVNTDYTAVYSNNIKTGTATITITFKASYSHLGSTEVHFEITAKPITIAIAANDKTYDGTTDAIATATIEGKIDGTDVSISGGTFSFSDKNWGYHSVNFSDFSLSGTDATNYVVSNVSFNQVYTWATINRKTLTITGVTAIDREYNGTRTVALTGGTLNGVITGDTVSFTLGNGTIVSAEAGSDKAVTTNISLKGSSATNYTLTQPTGITVEIISPNGSSSSGAVVSSSSSGVVVSSSSTRTPSSSSNVGTPIRLPQTASGNLIVKTSPNSITLENPPPNAKVEIYNLQGKRVYSTTSHSPLATSLTIGVQTGVYVIRIGTKTVRVVVR
ncbi:hypothetical protein R83H12_03115 [Fibrobacteria bacterium R8-3-H12]